MEPRLKECPFCGGQPYETRTVNGTQMYKIGCASCGIEFKAAWYRDADTPTKNIKICWNTRVRADSVSQEDVKAELELTRLNCDAAYADLKAEHMDAAIKIAKEYIDQFRESADRMERIGARRDADAYGFQADGVERVKLALEEASQQIEREK